METIGTIAFYGLGIFVNKHTGCLCFPPPLQVHIDHDVFLPETGQLASAPPDVRDYADLELHAKAFRLCGVQLKLSSTALVSMWGHLVFWLSI